MEIVSIEGSLTNFEVLELINSPTYNGYSDFNKHLANRRQLQSQQKKFELGLSPHEKTLQDLQTRLNHGELTEEQFRIQCSLILQKSSTTVQHLSRVRADIAYSHKIEQTIYTRTKLLKYLEKQPCRDQTQEQISQFFIALNTWQKKWYTTFAQSEIIMLINLRPITDHLLQLVLNGYFDRVQKIEAREELLRIIEILPEVPMINEADIPIHDDNNTNDDNELESSSEIDDDDGIDEPGDEFDNDAKAQRDQDDDHNGSDGD